VHDVPTDIDGDALCSKMAVVLVNSILKQFWGTGTVIVIVDPTTSKKQYMTSEKFEVPVSGIGYRSRYSSKWRAFFDMDKTQNKQVVAELREQLLSRKE
jgi:hypothetical protein